MTAVATGVKGAAIPWVVEEEEMERADGAVGAKGAGAGLDFPVE